MIELYHECELHFGYFIPRRMHCVRRSSFARCALRRMSYRHCTASYRILRRMHRAAPRLAQHLPSASAAPPWCGRQLSKRCPAHAHPRAQIRQNERRRRATRRHPHPLLCTIAHRPPRLLRHTRAHLKRTHARARLQPIRAHRRTFCAFFRIATQNKNPDAHRTPHRAKRHRRSRRAPQKYPKLLRRKTIRPKRHLHTQQKYHINRRRHHLRRHLYRCCSRAPHRRRTKDPRPCRRESDVKSS